MPYALVFNSRVNLDNQSWDVHRTARAYRQPQCLGAKGLTAKKENEAVRNTFFDENVVAMNEVMKQRLTFTIVC